LTGIENAEIYSVQQAARRKQVSVSTVYKAMRDGKLPSVSVLGRKGIRLTDIDAWSPAAHGGARRSSAAGQRRDHPRARLRALAREQGVKPIMDPSELLGDFDDVFTDDFDRVLREWRSEPQRDRL